MAFAGAVIELDSNGLALVLGEVSEASAFGQVLADETVGVLIGAALPSMVRGGEVDLGPEPPLDIFEAMELGAVVGGDAAHWVQFADEQTDDPLGGVLGGGTRQFGDADEAALPLHESENTGFAFTMHRVSLPVPEAKAVRHNVRPVTDHRLARKSPAAVLAAVAFAALLA